MTSTGTSIGTEAPVAAPSKPSKRPRWRMVLVLVVVVLVLAELFTRAIASHLPAPLQWDAYETQVKVNQIDALAQRGGADVVYFGSSIVDVGIDPQEVDRTLGGHITSYNAGLSAAIPRMTANWAEHVVIPRLHPKVIVIGLCSYDLGAEDPLRTVVYDAYLGSSGVRQVMGTDDPIQAVDRWLGEHSSLWLHKYQLRDPAAVLHAIEGHTPTQDPVAVDLAADGRQTDAQNQPYQDLTTVDVKGWRLGKKDTAAVDGLISYAHRRGIKVVLVDMPVAPQFVAATGSARYQDFNNDLGAIGRRTGATVLFYQTARNDSLFLNNIHLNHTGAELLSARLGGALTPIVRARSH